MVRICRRQVRVDQPLTDQRTILGTFQYMVPEQIDGQELFFLKEDRTLMAANVPTAKSSEVSVPEQGTSSTPITVVNWLAAPQK